MYIHSFDSGMLPDNRLITSEVFDTNGHDNIKIHSVISVKDEKTNMYKTIVLYNI